MSECTLCKNEFVRQFVCITCGAQKLHDETLRSAVARAERAEKELAAAKADAERLQDGYLRIERALLPDPYDERELSFEWLRKEIKAAIREARGVK